jgi:hypothetical protein
LSLLLGDDRFDNVGLEQSELISVCLVIEILIDLGFWLSSHLNGFYILG